ncbi:MAG: hypothetical protein CYPHOPRED_003472, partial [Cyphobasidiales sp. Tagirdzhanova-0007]
MSVKERELRRAPSEYTEAISGPLDEDTQIEDDQLESDPALHENPNLAVHAEYKHVHEVEDSHDEGRHDFDRLNSFLSTSMSTSSLPRTPDKPADTAHRKEYVVLPPSFHMDSLPSTPTMPGRGVNASASSSPHRRHYDPSPSSHRQFSRFFGPSGADSPRTQRIRLGLSGDSENSSTPAIGIDPLYALRLSMSHGSGFFMPDEDQ